MTNVEIISFTASIASCILAILAIALSIIFYSISLRNSTETTTAAKDIGSTVKKLEDLFDKLYNGIFGMMQETNSDMRKHIWPEIAVSGSNLTQEAENKADQKLTQLKGIMDQDIDKMLKHQKITDENLNLIQSQMRDLLNKAIDNSRKVESEARKETVRELIIQTINLFNDQRRRTTAEDVIEFLRRHYQVEFDKCLYEIDEMKHQGILFYKGTVIEATTLLRLTPEKK
jgi:CRISPR/Cas system CSM-associated protein Csm2 small subunit